MEQMDTLKTYGLRTRPALAGALLAATCLVPAAYAQTPRPESTKDGTVSKAEVSSGSLLLQSSMPGRYVEAPLVAADVKMDIAGLVIRTKLTQRFTNPTPQWVEGVYAFPLPEGAAVDTLKGDFASDTVRAERLEICKKCEYLALGSNCKLCGCFVHLKARYAEASCDINKW